MNFDQLSLVPEILKALNEKNYTSPTPIQKEAIPVALQGQDVLATAQTGTGKTAAFSIPIIQNVVKNKTSGKSAIKALILSPTRELAIQIQENIAEYAKYLPISHDVIYGGVKQHSQVQAIKKGIDILVATPGRLIDLHDQKLVDLSQVQYFVLDEADRMLDMGFINDIKRIIKMIPKKRQTLFFSATLAGNIKELSQSILYKPVRVAVDPPSSTAELVSQHIAYTNKDSKKDLLLHIIEEWKITQAIIFTRTKHGADKLVKLLRKQKIQAAALHGGKAQNNRQKTLNDFKDGKVHYLVATDIAARGIDIDKLGHVINYEIPNESEAYVHRIGRSGRAGEDGIAISLCEPEENAYVKDIEKLVGKKIDIIEGHPYPQTDKPMTEAEKKEWRREKDERKRAFFEARRAAKNGCKNQHQNSNKKAKSEKKSVEKAPVAKAQDANLSIANSSGTNHNTQQNSTSQKSKSKKRNKSRGQRRGGYSTEAKTLKDKYMWPLLD